MWQRTRCSLGLSYALFLAVPISNLVVYGIYVNTHMQYTEIFKVVKNENFQ